MNYALELQTKVLVPLDAAVDPQSGAAPWAHLPIPEERAEGLPPWLLHARKERHYLPLFTSVKNAEAEKASATRHLLSKSLPRLFQELLVLHCSGILKRKQQILSMVN